MLKITKCQLSFPPIPVPVSAWKSYRGFQPNPMIRFLKPFGFLDYVHLQQHAKCVISDSGTISEESAMLSFPAISLRQSMERPEAQDAGTIILTGFDTAVVMQSLQIEITQSDIAKKAPADYTITNTSQRVLKLILGLSNLNNHWDAIANK